MTRLIELASLALDLVFVRPGEEVQCAELL